MKKDIKVLGVKLTNDQHWSLISFIMGKYDGKAWDALSEEEKKQIVSDFAMKGVTIKEQKVGTEKRKATSDPYTRDNYFKYKDPQFLDKLLSFLPHYDVMFHADPSAGRIYIDRKDEARVRQIFQVIGWKEPKFVHAKT